MRLNDGEFEVSIIMFIIILLACIGIGSCSSCRKMSDMRDVIVCVTDKDIKRYNSEDIYLIFAEDKDGNPQVFEITDNWLNGSFDSSDKYAAIKIGNTYTFTVGGQRNQFMSWYPNIYEYKLVKENSNDT